MEKKLCRLITLISTFLIHHCSHLVQMSCISAVNPREEPQLADTLPNLPFDSRPVLSCHELVHLCGCHAFKEAPHSALETVDFFFFSVCDFETQQKKIFFLKSKKRSQWFLALFSCESQGGSYHSKFFFFFLSHIFDYQACSSLLSPLPPSLQWGCSFLSKHPEPILAVISLQFFSARSQGYSSPLPPSVRPDLHALRAAQGTSFRGETRFSILFPGCCSRKCARVHQ